MSTTIFAPPTLDPTFIDEGFGSPEQVAAEPPSEPTSEPPPDARWIRPSVIALLVSTGLLYMWGLGASGWANSFYSAAVQAGTKSWKAFFFGSFDAANFITVDKPPASLWVMEISARIFGVTSWSILVPQALEGVAAVGLLYATVRRWFSASAGLIAGAIMALTPVAALMFRFNNPDALLVLLLVASAYALTRSLENGSTKWLLFASSLIGFGFLAKMLQAFVVVPGFALVYLLAAPPRLRKRVWQLLLAGVAMFASAGWWVATVELSPTSWRPYVGGSTNNSVLNLIFGYNGLGRVTGNETGSVTGGGGIAAGGSMWGPTGWTRMFNSEFGGQASWLIPAALILGVAGLVVTRRKGRTDRSRAAIILWGSWLFVTAVVFSLSKGIIHPYYTVALAPAVGALVGIGGHMLWQRRTSIVARAVLAATVLTSSVWAYVLLNRSPSWNPWLRSVVVIAGVIAAVALLMGAAFGRRVATVAIAGALVAGLAGPFAYSIQTVAASHAGALPTAGPAVVGARGGFGGGPGGAGGRGVPGAPGGLGGGRQTTGNAPTAGTNGPPSFGGQGQGGPTGGPTGGNGAGGAGGLLSGSTPSAELTALLQTDAGNYTWVLATIGANQASGYQLASGDPVMAIGGFNGTDPTPTLAAFQAYVANGQIHYFITGGTGGSSSQASSITTWVTSNFTAVTVGTTTMYDLTAPLA